ncbi:MAG: type I-C CRISPR-associated protein Cas7/Csd2 [Oscillospiraceae bacterium]|jgi:CRISPR-associated protein Csd2|nr:type I-C CRISPR-associated protein Cas7/Csd2 [Oscillospiraceae bacterium]
MPENAIMNRYEFVLLYDVTNGNPNGDPDAGNMPRIDPETGHGLVTDVCIKRKIRNYVEMTREDEPGYGIYIKQDIPLQTTQNAGIEAVKSVQGKAEKSASFRDYMCGRYFDIRTFGAVMAGAVGNKELMNTAGQVRGPVQLAFGRSIDPIVPQEIAITRVAIETEKKAENASTEMGRKHIVPYGLYRQEGFISANLAQRITGFSDADLSLLWEAINGMFEFDRSAARGLMVLRGLYVFKHESAFGNAPAHKLFDLISVARKQGVVVPRAFTDYTVFIDASSLPEGVTLEDLTL